MSLPSFSTSPQQVRYSKRANSGFTLIELLVVVAVMLILIGLSLTGFGGARAYQLTGAGNQVIDLANQARQLAKARNSMIALVVVTQSNKPEWDYRSYALMELSAQSPTWRQISKWESIPEGIVIDKDKSVSFLGNSPELSIAAPALQRGEVKLKADSYAYQVFLPDGRLLKMASPPALFLRAAQGDNHNHYKIIFNNNTGIPLIERP